MKAKIGATISPMVMRQVEVMENNEDMFSSRSDVIEKSVQAMYYSIYGVQKATGVQRWLIKLHSAKGVWWLLMKSTPSAKIVPENMARWRR